MLRRLFKRVILMFTQRFNSFRWNSSRWTWYGDQLSDDVVAQMRKKGVPPEFIDYMRHS